MKSVMISGYENIFITSSKSPFIEIPTIIANSYPNTIDHKLDI